MCNGLQQQHSEYEAQHEWQLIIVYYIPLLYTNRLGDERPSFESPKAPVAITLCVCVFLLGCCSNQCWREGKDVRGGMKTLKSKQLQLQVLQ